MIYKIGDRVEFMSGDTKSTGTIKDVHAQAAKKHKKDSIYFDRNGLVSSDGQILSRFANAIATLAILTRWAFISIRTRPKAVRTPGVTAGEEN